MSIIYITGHRKPDLDSLCSAVGYANLKNLIDPRNDYVPVRCSHLSESTKKLLEALEIQAPEYKGDIYPKVSDVMLSSEISFEATDSIQKYADSYNPANPSAAPVYKDGEFCGLITVDDVTEWAVNSIKRSGGFEKLPTLEEVMHRSDERLQTGDRFLDGKKALQRSSRRGLPVYDDTGYAGFVTRRCFLNTPRHNIILVDHNEPEQSIKGIETANILEIIDHHRLNALKTDLPLFIDAEPLGSTCTIVYQLYLRNGIRPDQYTAKVLLTGILADTLIFRSPTTTRTDIESAEYLSAVCRVDAAEYGMQIFSSLERLKSRDPETAILSDFKEYSEKNVKFGIGQCEVTTLQDLDEYSDMYLSALDEVKHKYGLNWVLFMITDVMREQSVMLCTGFYAEKNLTYSTLKPHIYDLPGIMSRKKQLLPDILHTL